MQPDTRVVGSGVAVADEGSSEVKETSSTNVVRSEVTVPVKVSVCVPAVNVKISLVSEAKVLVAVGVKEPLPPNVSVVQSRVTTTRFP